MPGLVPGIRVFGLKQQSWMAGTSPAMTIEHDRRRDPPSDPHQFSQLSRRAMEVGRAGPVVLTGANGAGKTNLIEAISLLAPGRGLRRATMEELAFSEGDGAWAVVAEVEGMLGLATLGTGIDPPAGEDASPARKCRIDRERSLRPRPLPITCA